MALVKATLKDVSDDGEPVNVMFNPTEYSVTTNMTYADINVPGLRMPLLQFVRGQSRVMSVEFFLDSSDRDQTSHGTAVAAEQLRAATAGAISAVAGVISGPSAAASVGDALGGLDPRATEGGLELELLKLRKFVTIDKHLHTPPIAQFAWGEGREFTGVITEFSETFLMFNDLGHVIRAKVKISIKSYETAEKQYRELDLQSPDRTKTRVIKEGERLDTIAMEEYGNPREWRTLAVANDIARPRLIRPGDVLIIPPL